MDQIVNYILQFAHLNAQQIDLLKSKLEDVTIPKGGYFSEAGKIAKQVGFITSGVMRVCYYNKNGDEFTRCFLPEDRFVVDINSFYNESACAEYVEALTDCQLLIMSKESFIELTNTIVQWSDIFSKIMSKALMGKMHASSTMLSQDATERYTSFLNNYPGLANIVPLSALASYLGITQSSLSRIRKNIS